MRTWKTPVRVVFLLVALGFLAATLARQWSDVRAAAALIDAGDIAGSTGLALAGLAAQMLSWRALLVGTGHHVPLRAAARIYYVGQLGKYVPGGVWAVIAQADLARDHRVTRSRSAVVAIGALAVLVVVGSAVAALGLGAGSSESLATYWWVLLALPVGTAMLAPPVFNRAISLVLRVARRPLEPLEVSGRTMAESGAWALVMWICFGAHAWVLAHALGATSGAEDALVVTGAFAIAWVVGFLIVIAPAGAGAREAALVLALAPVLGRSDALVLALVSRVIMVVVDALAAGVASLRLGGRRREQDDASIDL